MKLPPRRHAGEDAANMTPMIDVVFLLIIFFLVSSHLSRQEARVPLELPAAATGEAPDPEDAPLNVNLTADSRLLIGGAAVDPGELAERLQTHRLRRGADAVVRLRVDRQTPYAAVIPVLQATAAAGLWDLRIATSEEPR